MSEALRIRDFRSLWLGRLVSQLGSWLLVVAVPAYVLELTGSVTAAGAAMAAEFLPPVVLGPFAGVVADRVDRRLVMAAADVLRAGAVAVLLVADTVWWVYVALVVESVGTVMFRPAAQAQTPVVVGTGKELTSANAVNAVTDGIVRLVGAPLGGALFAVVGFDLLVWLDLGTYVVSAVAVLCTARQEGSPQQRRERGGWTHVWRNPTTRVLVVVNGLFLGANASVAVLLVPYGMTVLGGSAATGAVMSALGIGFLLGGPLLRLVDRLPVGRLLGVALIVTGGALTSLFVTGSLVPALGVAVVVGAAGSTALGAVQTTVQRVTPNAVLGRVAAAMFTVEAAATFVGAVVGPAIAAAASLTWAAVLAGGLTVLSGLVAVVRLRVNRP
ncbi:MFS transporter [Actinokineospora inagensis]|uniref:MFS transporter n=1 Tax=Actinokineospora inagensis TaxID=103730 RepID=UPI00040F7009|nr:MFS transporter [Actinokineospora inagensis]